VYTVKLGETQIKQLTKTAKHGFTQRVDHVIGRFGDGQEDDQRLLIVC
jgi:hypothetical protein